MEALPAPRLTIPAGGRELELHYTGISFASPEKLRFRYQMEGLDRDWVEAGERRTAYYHHLAPGRYRFSVLACNVDGVWSKAAAALDITLRPYVWETDLVPHPRCGCGAGIARRDRAGSGTEALSAPTGAAGDAARRGTGAPAHLPGHAR